MLICGEAGHDPCIFVPNLHDILRHLIGVSVFPFGTAVRSAKIAVRSLAAHTGLPVLLIAALLVALGYRLLKRSMRFVVEVVVVTLVLLAATAVGWLHW